MPRKKNLRTQEQRLADEERNRDALKEDVEWLLRMGMHPSYICEQVGRSAAAIERMARLRGWKELQRIFAIERDILRGTTTWQSPLTFAGRQEAQALFRKSRTWKIKDNGEDFR